MPDSLLTTKLFLPPARPNRVSRPRLVAQLNQATLHSLTLIAAPAGFGKTTVLTEWIAQYPHHVAWVSLDEGDNDPQRFWAYVVAALQKLRPDFGQSALALLQSPQPPPFAPILTILINEIAALPDDFSLVFDDYHVIAAQPIHEAMSFLLDHLPPTVHLIITSRSDPVGLPLARLRARAQLAELRAEDLRFTPDEAATFLNKVMGLNLEATDIATIEQRTEGWVAALQLAALSIQGQRDAPGFIRTFSGSNRYLLDYLVEDVLNHQSSKLREFLLQTSILERLNGPLCDAILGEPGGSDSQSVLEHLEHNNLFVIPLDNDRRWYRYHHLFAEMLRHRLKQLQPSQPSELHRRASTWFEQSGLIVEAIDHALEAAEYDHALHLIEPIGMRVFTSNSMRHNVQTWLARLPDPVICSRPRPCLIHALLLMNQGNFADALRRVDDAEHALQQMQAAIAAADHENLRGEIAATRAILSAASGEFDPEQVMAWAYEALAQLHADNMMFRSASLGALGIAYLSLGDIPQAEESLAMAMTTAQAIGGVYMTWQLRPI